MYIYIYAYIYRDMGIVGLLVGFALSFTPLDPATGKTLAGMAENASDAAIERELQKEGE